MALPRAMTGVVLTAHGGPEALQYRDDLAVPQPGPTDVIIRVAAAGVNNTDINTRIGWYSKNDASDDDASWGGNPLPLPLIQGADVCGHIVAVGADIDAARIGERVLVEPCLRRADGQDLAPAWYIGSECNGGFAQYVCVDNLHAYAVNCDLTDSELASFPCSYSTAENMLTRANVQASDTVLITGASGGVGSAAIQLAKARGAKVIAVTSPAKMDGLRDLGADQTIARDADLLVALGKNTVDVVVDLVAGSQWPTLLDVLRPKGRYAVSGAIAGPIVQLDVRTLYLKDLSFLGCTVLEHQVFGNLVRHIEQGNIRPLVAATYPLRDINKAQAAFGEKQHTGKIVLTVD